MTSRFRLTPEQRWTVIREAWERGHFDRMQRLLLADATGLPPEAARWLAGVLSGGIKRKRGRPMPDPAKRLAAEVGREIQIREEYRGWLLVYQALADEGELRGDTPKERAISRLADIHGLTADAVSHIVHPRRPFKAPNSPN